MKAVVQDSFGPAEVLEVREVDEPAIKADQVLVEVAAAAVHIGDVYTMKGKPAALRVVYGLRGPRNPIPGLDIAGRVAQAGDGVTRWEVGDEVFGACTGACAEYAAADEDRLVAKPANLTFEQAAAVPTSGLAALQGMRDVGRVGTGTRVLIVGASGGVGSFAVQIAKALGAEVTGVCSTGNVDLVRSLGADHVIDYTEEDFTLGGPRYDVILDNVANRSLADCRRAVAPGGMLIPNGGSAGLGGVARAFLSSIFISKQGRPFLSLPKQEDLSYLRELLERGAVTPVVGRTFPLAETAEAMRHVETGHARGKTVITVAA